MVSICIPTYNHEKFLVETLQSVVSQTYANFEVIIIDDCSADATAVIARDFAARDHRITVQVNRQNLGMVPNWNRCLELARGTYIKYLFGDDFFSTADALARMVAAMEANPGAVLIAAGRTIVDEQSRAIEALAHFPDGFSVDGTEAIRRCLLRTTRGHNFIGEPSAVMFRRDSAIRGFDLRYRQLVDVEMWFHLLEQGRFVYLAAPLISFRHHSGQQTKKNVSELNFVDDLILLFDSYLGKPYTGIGQIARAYLTYYQFYKLQKHAGQGQHDMALVREKIRSLYGPKRFALLRPLYRLYTPYWQLKCLFFKAAGRW
jgi:glycosyltransferase involved in cell wall biosynthesis